MRLRGHPNLRLRTGREHFGQAGRRPGANERRFGHDLEHRASGGHSRHGRRRHRRRQRRQRRLDHRTADPDGHGRHEHRGPDFSQALRPHGGQGSHLGRGDGRQDSRLRRREKPPGQGFHHQRPHRRFRRPGPRRGHSPLQPVSGRRRRSGVHRRDQDPRRTSKRPSPRSRGRSRST